jgi:parallel beta-helix repeat protein
MSYAYIEKNEIFDNEDHGIYVRDWSNDTEILDNLIYLNDFCGIRLWDTHYLEIKDNEIYRNNQILDTVNYWGGMNFDGDASFNLVSNNEIYNNIYRGVVLDQSKNNTFEWNTISGTTGTYEAVRMINADGNLFESNTVHFNGYYGFYVTSGSYYNEFYDNHIDHNGYRNVYLGTADYTVFEYNTVIRASGTSNPMWVSASADYCEFYNNSFHNRGTVNDDESNNNDWGYNYYSQYTGYDNAAGPLPFIGDTADYTVPGAGGNIDLNPRTKITTTVNSTTYARIDTTLKVIESQRGSPMTITLPAATPNAGSRTIQQIGIWYENQIYLEYYDDITFDGSGPKWSHVDGWDNDDIFEFYNCDMITFTDLTLSNASSDAIYWETDDNIDTFI